jgi:hypothetical protein
MRVAALAILASAWSERDKEDRADKVGQEEAESICASVLAVEPEFSDIPDHMTGGIVDWI